MKNSSRIISELTQNSLTNLLDGKIDVIHIKGFYPSELSDIFAKKIIAHPQLGYYKKQNTVGRLGMGYVDVEKTPEFAEQYHNEAIDSIRLIRDLIYPYISPIDHLRLILQEIWTAGANVEQIDNQKCFVGTCRVFAPGVKLRPHTDKLARLLLNGNTNIKGQLTANIYLEMPEEGGELELWLSEPTKEQEKIIEALDGVDREELGPPQLLIKPDIGDLIIFNAGLMHNVTPGKGSLRVSISSFIGYREQHSPLTYWS